MREYKKIKIEYIMMAVAFASVVWSIFAGFRISRFQWIFVIGSVIWFLGMCRLLDQNKRNIVVMAVICIIYFLLAHRQLINGFRIINNKMAEATYYGTGRRKTSVARVRLVPGQGKIIVNGRELKDYFALKTMELIIKQPLELTGTTNAYDVLANVQVLSGA